MKTRRFNFADQYEAKKPPVSVWLTRSIVTGLLAGFGAAAYALGYLHL